jgi:RNA polymerase sigma-70 factor (ECF subfamily)
VERRIADVTFESTALPWMDAVYRFALSLSGDADDARDVSQETFLRAFRFWHTYEQGSDCRKWLFAICRNTFLRMRERERVTVDVDDEELDSLAAVTELARATREGEDDLLSRIALGPALRGALAALQEPFRSAVVLVDLEDMTYQEASVVLEVPVGTVRSRLFRGRRLLQGALMEHARDHGFLAAQQIAETGS